MNKETIGIITSGLGSALVFFMGGADLILITMLTFIVIDYISGVALAFIKKTVSSEIGFKGILKKCLIILMVVVATLLDKISGNENMIFRTAVVWFYIANEGISICENFINLGIPVPNLIKKALSQINNVKK